MAKNTGASILFGPFALWQLPRVVVVAVVVVETCLSFIFHVSVKIIKREMLLQFWQIHLGKRRSKVKAKSVQGAGRAETEAEPGLAFISLSLCLRIINGIVVVVVVASCRLSFVCRLSSVRT